MRLHFPITYKCNLTCSFCSLWKLKGQELTVDDLQKRLPAFRMSHITFGGGEPFLRKDLVELVKTVVRRTNSPSISFFTNGQLTKRITKYLREISIFFPRKIFVYLSIDGPKEYHDKIRGGKGIYDRTIATVEKLKEDYPIGISYTICPENFEWVYETFKLAQSYGASFSTRIAHPLAYQKFTSHQLEIIDKQVQQISQESINEASLFSLYNSFFLENIVKVYRSGKRAVPCMAGIRFMVLDPYGAIYPCFPSMWGKEGYGNSDYSYGNIKDVSIGEIRKRRKEVLRRLKPALCNKCWNGCDVLCIFKGENI